MKPAGLDTANQHSRTTEAIVLVMNMRFSLVRWKIVKLWVISKCRKECSSRSETICNYARYDTTKQTSSIHDRHDIERDVR